MTHTIVLTLLNFLVLKILFIVWHSINFRINLRWLVLFDHLLIAALIRETVPGSHVQAVEGVERSSVVILCADSEGSILLHRGISA